VFVQCPLHQLVKIRHLLIVVIFAAIAVAAGCGRDPQATITKLSFGSSAAADPSINDFEVNKTIFAVAKVAGAKGRHSINFQVTALNGVANKGDGDPVMNKQVEFEGEQPLFMSFQLAYPGQYKIEAVLSDDKGAVLDLTAGNITVTGDPPVPEDERERERELGEDKQRGKDKDRDRDSKHEREREKEHERERK
jgi:hypothetical protein